jgi:hypothetical protein
LTDYAPEFLLGAFAGEGTIETFQLGSGTVNPGDLVKLSSSAASAASTVVPVAASGDPVIGVVQRVWTAMGTTWVSVIVRGKVKITAGAAVSVGAKLKASTQSLAVAAVIGTDPVNAIFGTALQTASANGDAILAIIDTAGA